MNEQNYTDLTKLIRSYILRSTTAAKSGHPTSSLSAVELMTSLFFEDFFKYDPNNPGFKNNDRLIFSKGHASPLFYSLWAAAGLISEDELLTLRKFNSRLEGHPTLRFPYTEVPTGSLGQGLSVGVGMALNAKHVDQLSYKTFVLLGDGEMTEGSNWEAMQIASQYKLNNLIGIIDVSRFEQVGETIYNKKSEDHGADDLKQKVRAFGWNTIVVDGHSQNEVKDAYQKAIESIDKPTMIIAITSKGKGISLIEDKDDWHGKALTNNELDAGLLEIGNIDANIKGIISPPKKELISDQAHSKIANESNTNDKKSPLISEINDSIIENNPLATRKIYGHTLNKLFSLHTNIISLDAGMSNSTYSQDFKNKNPDSFFEMFIAEQNMIGIALGLSKRGKLPFVSTFASFLTRAYDQLRMATYSEANINIVGSHAGVSIGEDGASQMGLEDISMFRSLYNSNVLYPSDVVSAQRLLEIMPDHNGLSYIRLTRMDTPIIYNSDDEFIIGGSKTLRSSDNDTVTIACAGITVHEAIKAYEELNNIGINIRVIDLYSIKPIDKKALIKASKDTQAIIVVEDHYQEGGINEAVKTALENTPAIIHALSVNKLPRSGTPDELLSYEKINSVSIVELVKDLYT